MEDVVSIAPVHLATLLLVRISIAEHERTIPTFATYEFECGGVLCNHYHQVSGKSHEYTLSILSLPSPIAATTRCTRSANIVESSQASKRTINDVSILEPSELLSSNGCERFSLLKLLQRSGEELSVAKSDFGLSLCVPYSLKDLIPKLIFIKEISKVTKIEVLDVSTVREKCGIKCRSDDRPPQYGPTLDSE